MWEAKHNKMHNFATQFQLIFIFVTSSAIHQILHTKLYNVHKHIYFITDKTNSRKKVFLLFIIKTNHISVSSKDTTIELIKKNNFIVYD